MSRPLGVGRASKDNSQKHPQAREEWMEGKKIGRSKQVWVFDEPLAAVAGEQPSGHWEKI